MRWFDPITLIRKYWLRITGTENIALIWLRLMVWDWSLIVSPEPRFPSHEMLVWARPLTGLHYPILASSEISDIMSHVDKQCEGSVGGRKESAEGVICRAENQVNLVCLVLWDDGSVRSVRCLTYPGAGAAAGALVLTHHWALTRTVCPQLGLSELELGSRALTVNHLAGTGLYQTIFIFWS